MNSSSVITLEEIIERCLAKHFGQNDVVKALISDDTYQICWDGMIKWIKNEIDLGRAVKIPNMGLISMQTYRDDSIIYFKFSDNFLRETDLIFERLDIKEVRYPTVLLNFWKMKISSKIDREIMISAIQNLLMEIEDIFQSFDNFEMDLGALGKFFVDEKNLRFMPFTRSQLKKKSQKMTIKNLIDIHMKKNEALNSKRYKFKRPNFSGLPKQQMSRLSQSGASQRNSRDVRDSQSKKSRIEEIEPSQRSFNRSIFSQGMSNEGQFVSPMRRQVKPNNDEEQQLTNQMFGAGTDPLALNQNFSLLAQDAHGLMFSQFIKPDFAQIRCPPVIDKFSRTLAAPVASQYNSLSASSRIALFYSVATKYLYFDSETNGIAYLKIKENQTKLTANEELLQAVATQEEEMRFILDEDNCGDLAPKVEAKKNCHDRYKQYIYEEIPRDIVAPIRQYWITNILDLIPANYRDLDQMKMESIIDDILNEINEDYYIAIKKSILDYILKEDSEKLRIGILERFDPAEEYGEAPYRGVVIDDEWVETVSKSRATVRQNLVSYCQGTLSIIKLWTPKGRGSFFELPTMYGPQLYLHEFLKIQSDKTEKIITNVRESWIPEVAKIYQKDLDEMNKEEIIIFFRASTGLMSCQIRELIYKSLKELRDFMRIYKKPEGDSYLEPIDCIKNDEDPMQMNQKSFMKIAVKKDPTKICLSDDRIQIKSDFNEIIDRVVFSSKKLPLPEKKISRSGKNFLWSVDEKKDELVLSVKQEINEIIDKNMEEIEKVSELFVKYQFLISDQKKIEQQIEDETTKKGYQAMIDKFRNYIIEIEDEVPYEIYMSMALVDCRQIKKDLIDYCNQYIERILKKISDSTLNFKSKISEDIGDMVTNLQKGCQTAHDLEEAQNYIDTIEKELKSKIENDFKQVVDWIDMLYDNQFKVLETFLTSTDKTAEKVHQIDSKLEDAKNRIENEKNTIEKKLKEDKAGFLEELEGLQKRINDVKKNGSLRIAKEMSEKVLTIDKDIKYYQEKAEDINFIEEKVGYRVTKFKELEKSAKDIIPFKDLWVLAHRWKDQYSKKWYEEPIFKLETDEILKKVKIMGGTLQNIKMIFENMEEQPKNAIDEIKIFAKKIEEFRSLTPLLVSLSARGMQERHWKEINMICKNNNIAMTWNENSEHSLTDANIKGMMGIIEQLTEISVRANREFSNYNLLEEMEGEWKDVDMRLKEWNDSKTYVIQGETVDELTTLLDDHIIKTQTMKGSSSAKVFEGRINSWDTDLCYIRDTLEVWIKVQSNWLFLQPIFLSPDIKRELVEEAKKFTSVDKRWRELMTSTLKHPRAMEIAKNERLKDRLFDMFEQLEKVKDKLNDYLNKKRAEFPRFYFLSSDALIEVLSEARDPTKIQKYAKILFGGLKRFTFDKEDRILGVESSEGEKVEFTEPVETAHHEGLVEKWLANFEETLRIEVRRFIEISFEDFEVMERNKFVLDRPAMAVLNVNMTKWTHDTEEAISNGGPKGLTNFDEVLKGNLEKIVELVKSGISKLNRCTLESLIVLDVHNRVVISDLIEADVQSITDFDYESQLRYYWQQKEGSNNPQKETMVKMISYTLDYSYEYLGNSSRLVITPLTDRCYRTLCGAIGLYYGGAPEGPAGTGKTETVKDLAKALARLIVVFNCGENLNYLDMARFFKGLASTGGWSCFDEFNLIKLEVLSVIAQQLQQIQNAVKDGLSEFFFVDTKIKLKTTCNVFITMNPPGNPDSDSGYAGRQELPDNLKALFRTVAMMVPDYTLIAEIRLYSFGFVEAPDLARKIVTTYKLCSEQIAYQKHYDYGMRAVNSVLKAAGNLRKADPHGDEYVQVLRAINEVNEAKFLSLDLPLFKAITFDLFPETVLPEIDIGNLLLCLNEVMEERKLQAEPYFIEKVIQLYQMIIVRHGLMIVGEAFSAKSTAITALAQSLTKMNEKGYGEKKVQLARLNPKSCTNAQLYGISDVATEEWTDGVLPVIFKRFTNSESPDRKWMWFDGPVDAIWIESMNTVFDSNKKLCLSNGDIFYMSDTMNLICEPRNLIVASPATVSRVGMVYMQPHMMGWMYLYKSWKLTLPPHFEDYVKDDMDVFFLTVLTPLLNLFENGVFGMTAPTIAQNILYTLLNIANTYIRKFDELIYDAVEFKQRKAFFDMIFAFATVWSAGATVTNEYRQKFDTSLRRYVNSADKSISEELKKLHRRIKLPDSGKVFDFILDYKVIPVPNEKPKVVLEWKPWSDQLLNANKIPRKAQANQIIVQTVDSVRYTHMIELYMNENLNSLICGPTGTGKTIYIKKLLKELNTLKYQPLEIGFSAQTTAMQVQNIIDGALKRRKKGVYGPPPGKKMIIFVDDLNMPRKEKYGAQPPIELLRQMIDQGGWYDHEEKEKPFKKFTDIVFMSAMGPPGDGRNFITPRFQRHLCMISFTSLDENEMMRIFQTILNWKFETGEFAPEIKTISKQVVKATLQMYQEVCENFLPMPSKSHYLFNLRDFSRVVMGICMTNKESVPTKQLLIKLWIHEIWRVFSDRLNSEEDRLDLLQKYLKPIATKVFGENYDALLFDLDLDDDGKIDTLQEMRGLIFSDVMYPGTMRDRPYELINDQEKLYKACNGALKQYDLMSDKPLNIVLFNFAVEHLLIISRILKQPGGNGLLVGVGGSGRQSLTRLAATMAANNIYQIELTKKYGMEEWKEDLKATMKNAGKGSDTVFLFTDNQIKKESFIEDINNLLNNGEVPNLFPPEEKGDILEIAREVVKDNNADIERTDDLLAYFIDTVKKHLHVVLCFSPLGNDFKDRIRMFPSLVNCCTIDWFFEWPEEALQSVAETFLSSLPLSKEIIEKCVVSVQNFHKETTQAAGNFLSQLGRHYYVTPTSYIEMINQFKILLEEKSEEVGKLMNKYKNGYEMIIDAEKSVSEIQVYLTKMVPEIEKAKVETEANLKLTNTAKAEAEVVEEKVSKEKEKANKIREKAKFFKDQADAELAKVMPAIQRAKAGLENIKVKDFEKLRGAKTLSTTSTLVFEALCYIMVAPADLVKEKNNETLRIEPNYWKTTQKLIMDHKGLIQRMKTYNGNNNVVPEKVYKKLKKFFKVNAEPLSMENVQFSSSAIVSIFTWIDCQVELYPAEINARPKRKAKESAEAELKEANKLVAEKEKELKAVTDKLNALNDNLNRSLKKKADLEAEYKKSNEQLVRAEALIQNLGEEKGRWNELSEVYGVDLFNLTGDVLVSAGLISYCGPFTSSFRSQIVKKWAKDTRDMEIPGSTQFDFVKTMGKPVHIRQWQIDGLPSDTFSTQNAIIMKKAQRWALCIDPQQQANKWIKNTYKKNPNKKLIITKLDYDKYMNDIEMSIRTGLPCLVEGVGEKIPASLNPVLLKQVTKVGGTPIIKLGDKQVDYDEDFFLVLTSKSRNPHYMPDVSTKVTIINFMITTEGLTDQLLATIVSKEKPALEKEKNRLIEESAANKAELQDLEDKILEILQLPKSQLLEDEKAIDILKESKTKSTEIKEKQKIADKTEAEIDAARTNYVGVSQEASCLFFVITDLGEIDPMYQYSLGYFLDLFKKAIEVAEESEDLDERLSNVKNEFLYSLYRNVSRSLFVKDKLLFSFLLCVRLKEFKGEIERAQYLFLLTGAVGAVTNLIKKPDELSWIKDQSWSDICKLSEFGGRFDNLHINFMQYYDDWKRIYDSREPHKEPFPEIYENSMTDFEKLLIMRSIRMEKLKIQIQHYVINNMGKKYAEVPTFKLDDVYKDSTNTTPLIFVLTPGVDPFSSLLQFAESESITPKGISLGQGQGDAAIKLIDDGMKNGEWVILQNCHLAEFFMPRLEIKADEIAQSGDQIHKDFRLWLTSNPSEYFPTSILENGVKMTNEPPSGLKNNLKSAFNLDDVSNDLTFNVSPNLKAYRRLVFSLCFFHSIIQERRKFGALGWNIAYQFTESDLRISAKQLYMFIEKYPNEVPLDAIIYLTGDCNYGGRVTDDKDRRLLKTILNDYYNEDAYTIDNYALAPGHDEYFIPNGAGKVDFLAYIEELPIDSPPGVLGFHPNANITKEIKETTLLLNALFKCQGVGSSGGGSDKEKIIEFIDIILEDFPEEFDVKEARKKYPNLKEESMNTVLVQELVKFNILISLVKNSLEDIKKALKGLIILSFELEAAANYISLGKVPSMWNKVSYATRKPLGGYIKNLRERTKFFGKWVENGKPAEFWLGGFYSAQGFITGVLQNYARKYMIAIDELVYDMEVLREDYEPDEGPEDGTYIYGMFLEGAKFNFDTMLLDESDPKILFTKCPKIFMKPALPDKIEEFQHYLCPLYLTSVRYGELLTTGHSTNYVMSLKIPTDYDQSHWIKRGVAALTQLDD